MIQLKPQLGISIICPSCQNSYTPSNWILPGMHVMAEGICPNCEKHIYQEIPINAGAFYPGILDGKTGKRIDKLPFDNWYLNGLEESYISRCSSEITFTIKNERPLEREKIAILNTIDQTYGHSLYELLNASYYLKKSNVDLIIIVQKEFSWMLPDGAAQIWIVDIPFSEANNWNDWVSEKIKTELSNFNNVFLCRSFVQADSLEKDQLLHSFGDMIDFGKEFFQNG
jgi:hypothetical protein